MNANKTLLRKKILEIDFLNILVGGIIGKFLDKFLDQVFLIVKNKITTIQDVYRWRKRAMVCSFLDVCEETGESINGRVVLGVDSFGQNSCGGCYERFACREKKPELKEMLMLEAKLTDDDLSDEKADISAEKIIRDREMFYLIKKFKAPSLFIKKQVKNLKWKWGLLRNKKVIMGCKSCGAMWFSAINSSYETCPDCDSMDYTNPIQQARIDFNVKDLSAACRKTKLKLSKLDNSLSRSWSKNVENESGSWGITIITLLNPNKKDVKFICGNISLNMDVITSRFFVSVDEINDFISNFDKHYA